MQITDHPTTEPIPVLGEPDCPDCGQPRTPGHTCGSNQ